MLYRYCISSAAITVVCCSVALAHSCWSCGPFYLITVELSWRGICHIKALSPPEVLEKRDNFHSFCLCAPPQWIWRKKTYDMTLDFKTSNINFTFYWYSFVFFCLNKSLCNNKKKFYPWLFIFQMVTQQTCIRLIILCLCFSFYFVWLEGWKKLCLVVSPIQMHFLIIIRNF